MSAIDAIRRLQAEQKAEREAAAAEKQATEDKPKESNHAGTARSSADSKAEHESLMDECSKVDMLALVREYSGEQGEPHGDRVDFRTNPITGTHNDLSVYPATNSWASYTEQLSEYRKNGKDYVGGNPLDFLELYHLHHGGGKTEAVRELHERSGTPFDPDRPSGPKANADKPQDGEQDGVKQLLPPWTAIQATDPPRRSPALIDGVVRLGHVLLLAGKGKIGKSWSAIELCAAVATGRAEWFGLPLKSSGACLYVDPEIDARSLDNRFHAVCDAMGADSAQVDARVSKWSLRGVAGASMDAIIHDLKARCEFGQFVLVVVDSCSVFVEGDENSSVDVRRFASKVLRVAAITGATVMLVHHFGKAKDGDRSASDRARGSSVWLDFPDAVLTLTEVQPPSGEASDYLQPGEYACLLESGGIREFPRMEPVRLIFGYPVHRVDAEGITESWKPASSERDGGKRTAELNKARKDAEHAQIVASLAAGYYSQGVGADGLLLKDAAELCGCDSRKLASAVESSELFELVQVTQRKRYVVAVSPPRAAPEETAQLDLGSD